MDSNSYGTLAEGTLTLIDGEWYIVPEGGERYPVQKMLQSWSGVYVRLTIANLALLRGIEAGKELQYVESLSVQEISDNLKRR